ncbi:hypothetical protein V6N12_052825 [Hibiscus sabdariffa]|uniref:Uncharacterized protein n=1 Tax=Hibiscus sabdariffa TaxID=183260 RepID=A0ABR2C2S8_9ROSI
MDSGLRAFIPAQFNSFVTVRNHHYLLTEAKRDEVRSYFRNSYSSIARGCLLLSWSFARKDGSKTSDPGSVRSVRVNAFLSLCARGFEMRVFRRTSNKAFGLKRSLREAQVRRQQEEFEESEGSGVAQSLRSQEKIKFIA